MRIGGLEHGILMLMQFGEGVLIKKSGGELAFISQVNWATKESSLRRLLPHWQPAAWCIPWLFLHLGHPATMQLPSHNRKT